MKRCLFVLSFFVPLHASSVPATDADFAQQAATAFEQKQYDRAYVFYEKIIEKTPAVHYHLSVCASLAGRLGYAQLHLRRAEMDCGLSGQRKIRVQREAIKQMCAQKYPAKQKSVYLEAILAPVRAVKQVCIDLVKAIPLIYFQFFMLLVWVCLFLWISMLIRRRKKALLVLLFLLQIGAATALALKYNVLHKKFLVVLRDDIALYSGPGSDYAMLGHLQEAQEADILNEASGYYKVRAAYVIGWVEKSFVEKV